MSGTGSNFSEETDAASPVLAGRLRSSNFGLIARLRAGFVHFQATYL